MDKTQEAARPAPQATDKQVAAGIAAAAALDPVLRSLYPSEVRAIYAAMVEADTTVAELVAALRAIKKIFDKEVTFVGGGPQSRVEVPFESHDQSWNHWHEARDLIRAAIAKATGAQA